MNFTDLLGLTVGLIGLECVFIIMDHFMVKLCYKVNPPGSPLTKEEWMLTFASEEERKRFRFKKKKFDAIMAHRMRRSGVVVVGVGLLGLVLLLLFGSRAVPSDNLTLGIANLLYAKVRVPWGRINIISSLGLLAIGIFLIVAGIAHLRRKPKPWILPAVICIGLGLFWVIFAISPE